MRRTRGSISKALMGVSLALALLLTLSAAASAQARGQSGLPGGGGNPLAAKHKVVDANGNQIGDFVGISHRVASTGLAFSSGPSPVVLLTTGGVTFAVEVLSNRFVGTAGLGFDGLNCTGRMYLRPFNGSTVSGLLPPVAIGPTGLAVFVADANAPFESVRLLSQLGLEHSTLICSNRLETSFGLLAIPAASLTEIDLGAEFTPPFALR